MDKIIKKLRPLAAFLALGCLWGYLLFSLIYGIGFLAEGGGAGQFIGWFIIAAFIGLVSFAYFVKKKDLLNVLVVLLLAYYAMRAIFGSPAAFSFGGEEGVGVAYKIFDLFGALCLLGAFVLYLLQLIFQKLKNNLVIRIIIYGLLAGHVVFLFVGWILYIFRSVDYYGNYSWMFIINGIGTMLLIPAAFLFGFMYFNEEGEDKDIFAKKEKAPKAEKKEEIKAEPKEESPAEEPKVEEAPTE